MKDIFPFYTIDRLVHNAHRIEIKEESMRKKMKNNH